MIPYRIIIMIVVIVIIFGIWIASLILRKRDLQKGIPAERLPGILKSNRKFSSIDDQIRRNKIKSLHTNRGGRIGK